jgi:hypothetical protein
MSDGLVVSGIQGRITLILCICKVDNGSGSENWRCKATNIKNEVPHLRLRFSKSKVGVLLFIPLEGKSMSQIDKNPRKLKELYYGFPEHRTALGQSDTSIISVNPPLNHLRLCKYVPLNTWCGPCLPKSDIGSRTVAQDDCLMNWDSWLVEKLSSQISRSMIHSLINLAPKAALA